MDASIAAGRGSMDQARKWMSVGAGTAGFLLSVFWMAPGLLVGFDLFSVIIMVLTPVAITVVAVMGARWLCRVGPDFLNNWPPPFLVALGFVLGALIVFIGVIYAGLRLLAALGEAL